MGSGRFGTTVISPRRPAECAGGASARAEWCLMPPPVAGVMVQSALGAPSRCWLALLVPVPPVHIQYETDATGRRAW